LMISQASAPSVRCGVRHPASEIVCPKEQPDSRTEKVYTNATLPDPAVGHLSFTTKWDPPKVEPVHETIVPHPRPRIPVDRVKVEKRPKKKAGNREKHRRAAVWKLRQTPTKPALPAKKATPASGEQRQFSPLRLPYSRQ
jgi:hypothetical protein